MKPKALLKFFLQEVEQMMTRLESYKEKEKASGCIEAPVNPEPTGAKADHQDQPYSPATVSVNAPSAAAADADVPPPSPLDVEDKENPPELEAGVQTNPLPSDDVISERAAASDSNPQTQEDDMIIKSTDHVGPDITLSDVPNPGLTATENDGKAVDKSDAVDTDKINLPTPIGAQAEQSVNGPVPEDEPEGDSSPVELPEPEEREVQEDIKPEDAPKLEVPPEDENAQPLANTKVTSTFDPIELKTDAPVLSPLQPEAETLSVSPLDKQVLENPEEAFPTATEEGDKETAPLPLGDDAAPSNAAAPSEIVKSEDDSEAGESVLGKSPEDGSAATTEVSSSDAQNTDSDSDSEHSAGGIEPGAAIDPEPSKTEKEDEAHVSTTDEIKA